MSTLRIMSAASWLRYWLAALVAGWMILIGAPSQAQAQMKIAVIDLRRAVADTEDGLRMKGQLQELFDVRQAEYDKKEKAYGAAKVELKRLSDGGKTPETELRKKLANLEKLALDLQRAGMAFRREMQTRESELMAPILTKLNKLVRRLASQSSYDMVLDHRSVPYFRTDLDITDRVIQMYNAATAGSDTKPNGPPAKPAPKAPPPAKK